jgi:hypothetical protein
MKEGSATGYKVYARGSDRSQGPRLYYNDIGDCKAACALFQGYAADDNDDEHPLGAPVECVAFVDYPDEDPPYCYLKSNTARFSNSNTADRDVYIKETTCGRVEQLQSDKADLEAENEQLQSDKDMMEGEIEQLQRDKDMRDMQQGRVKDMSSCRATACSGHDDKETALGTCNIFNNDYYPDYPLYDKLGLARAGVHRGECRVSTGEDTATFSGFFHIVNFMTSAFYACFCEYEQLQSDSPPLIEISALPISATPEEDPLHEGNVFKNQPTVLSFALSQHPWAELSPLVGWITGDDCQQMVATGRPHDQYDHNAMSYQTTFTEPGVYTLCRLENGQLQHHDHITLRVSAFPSPPPPSSPPPSLSPPPSPPCTRSTCAEDIFWTKAELKSAVNKWIASPAAAEAEYGAIADWDTSGVDDMSDLFLGMHNFNGQIGGWDTSKVTTMVRTFYYARAFNQPLDWDMSKVTTMEATFVSAEAFNAPLVWDTSKVTTFGGFSMCDKLPCGCTQSNPTC